MISSANLIINYELGSVCTAALWAVYPGFRDEKEPVVIRNV